MPSSPALLPEGEGSTWPVGSGFIETGGGPDGTRWRPGAWRRKLAAGSRIPFHSVRATGFGSVFGSWWPSSPALLPEGEGSTWLVGSGFIKAGGRPDGTRWRPGAWRHKLAGNPGFRFTPSGLRVLGPFLARGGPHPQPFSRREKGALGWWAQVLSRPVVARMERGGIRQWRHKLAGDPGFRFTPSGLRVLGPRLALGRPHPQPFSRREKGALGRWAQVLSRPVVARMERGGGRGRGVTSLRGIPAVSYTHLRAHETGA